MQILLQPSEFRSFLELLDYYGRFLQNLSTSLQPLHNPLHKQSRWRWTAEASGDFNAARNKLPKSNWLTGFDLSKPLFLAWGSTLLDLFITSIPGRQKPASVVGLQLSDNLSIYVFVELAVLTRGKIDVPGTSFQNANPRTLQRFDELICKVDWGPVFLFSFPDDAYKKWILIFKNVAAFPTKRIKEQNNPVSFGLR